MNVCLAGAVLVAGSGFVIFLRGRAAPPPALVPTASVRFAAYLGGSEPGQARDVCLDLAGNIYVTGGTASRDFPRTQGPEHQGSRDVFVAKLDPDGVLLWSRLLGGSRYDRAYAIELDGDGNVLVGGRAGPGYPTTAGVVQAKFGGDRKPGRHYGPQDGFVTKLSADGRRVLWSTYFGGDSPDLLRDIAVDSSGNVYLALCNNQSDHPHITAGAYQTKRPSGRCAVVAKLSADGSRVIWASYLGGADGEPALATPSIRVARSGAVVIAGGTRSGRMPITPGAYDPTFEGRSDFYVARFVPDGSDLAFATYLGGSDAEFGDTHNLVLDADGSVVVAFTTKSADLETSEGAHQRVFGGSGGGFNQTGDGFVARLSADGQRLLGATYLGGRSGEGLEGVVLDADGNICVSGGTYSSDLPVVNGGQGPTQLGKKRPDAYVARLSGDLQRVLFASYYGGTDWDLGLAVAVAKDGALVLVGETSSADFPLVRPYREGSPKAKGVVVVSFRPENANR